MKKLTNTALYYAIAAMISGVFAREFTKFNAFEGKTSLWFTHLHLFIMGTIMFLVLSLFAKNFDLLSQKGFAKATLVYNIGLVGMVAMFYLRGILQVLNTPLTAGANAAISGVAGIAHIVFAVGIVLVLLCIRRAASQQQA